MDDRQLEVYPSIQAAIEWLGNYSAVKCIKDVSVGQFSVIVKTKWAVKLPNQFSKQGVSDTGVRETETVYWSFPLDYPQSAPSPRLRADFPTNLPHINPYTKGELVYPCISELSLVDLLHSMGLIALFDAACQWLDNAAANELHCPVQGWEHVRRDSTKGLVHADTYTIRNNLDSSNDVVNFFNYRYYRMESSDDLLVGEIITPGLGGSNTALKKKNLGIDAYTSIRSAPAVLFRTKDGAVFGEYRPETVHNFKSLRDFANELGLQHALEARLKHILTLSSPQSMLKQDKAPVEEFIVIFAVKRPFNLIGTKSPWELLAYRVFFNQDLCEKIPDDSVILPTQLIERTCPQLLQAVSGDKAVKPVELALLGCGSLGSKVSLHLAKTGCYQFQLVDNDYFSSHNNARHGLIIPDFSSLCFSKSQLLHRQLSNLHVESKPIDKDILSMGDKEGFLLNKKTDFVLDTTASLPVRYYLSHHCKSLRGRLVQSVLYGKSTMAVVALEGKSRSVRVDDIAAFVNTLCIGSDPIKNALYGGDGPQLNHFGEGCGSETTIMNDIDISLMSASVSSRIHAQIQNSSDTPEGVLHVGTIDHSSLDMVWMNYQFPQTVVIHRNNEFDWDVRILGSVAKIIEELSNIDPLLENGGIIAGQVCHLSKTIYVNYLLDAPKSSERTRNSIILNVQGLAEEFEYIHIRTNGQITFLGTWHSHTSAAPPSTIDKDSLKQLQMHYDLPIVMLTYTGGHIVRVEC
ncbi:MAG: ThiF family adenylyltransferase [Candidatus Thiodiazotropha endolucinida]